MKLKLVGGKTVSPEGVTGMLWGWKCGWPHEHVCLVTRAVSEPLFKAVAEVRVYFHVSFGAASCWCFVFVHLWLHEQRAVDWLLVATLTFSKGLLTACRRGSNTLQRRQYTLLLISAWVAEGGEEVGGPSLTAHSLSQQPWELKPGPLSWGEAH